MSLGEARLRPSSASVAPPPAAAPRPILGLRDAVGIIVGIIIGAGIFKTPALVAGNVDGIATLVLAWVAGDALKLCRTGRRR